MEQDTTVEDLLGLTLKYVTTNSLYQTVHGEINFNGQCIMKLIELIVDIDARNLTSKTDKTA